MGLSPPPEDDLPEQPQEIRVPLQAIRGRGAATAMAHRFAKDQREGADDGWSPVRATGNAQDFATRHRCLEGGDEWDTGAPGGLAGC